MNDSRKLIRSVSEAIERLREIESDDELYDKSESPFHKFPFGLWFRGHFRDHVTLEPRVFRDRLPERDQSIIPPTGRCDGEGRWDETNVFEHLKLRVPSHEHTSTTPPSIGFASCSTTPFPRACWTGRRASSPRSTSP